MKALVLERIEAPLEVREWTLRSPKPGEAVVELKAAALNRRDYWITQGLYPGIQLPVVPGSDGAGVVVELGEGAEASLMGREVIINPGFDWGESEVAQAGSFKILGMPDDGTLARKVVVPARNLFPRPEFLSWAEAAALPLAGLTACRAVFSQGRLRKGERVLVTGIGGGVATFALQFARAAGAEVWVTSSSSGKRKKALELGAKAAFDYRDETWAREAAALGNADLIVDGAGGSGWRDLVSLAAPGGRIVNYGATAGAPGKVDLFKIFWKQLHIIGSTMGSPRDFQEMLDLVNRHRIRPAIDEVFPLERAPEAFERMAASGQFGKLVIAME